MITHHVKYDKNFNIREFTEKYFSDIMRYITYDKKGNILLDYKSATPPFDFPYWVRNKYDKWGNHMFTADSHGYWSLAIYHEPIKIKKKPYKHNWLILTTDSNGGITCYDLYNRPIYNKNVNGSWHRTEYINNSDGTRKKVTRSDGQIMWINSSSTMHPIEELEEYYDYYMQFYTEEFNHPKPSDLTLDENTLR